MANEMTDYKPRIIREWLEKIREGQIALPRFQRSYVWKEAQVSKLLVALLTDRPVGSLLLINFTNSQCTRKFQSRPFFSVGDKDQTFKHCEELVLDGQQRLTSLWRALDHRQNFFVEIDDWATDELAVAKTDVPVHRERENARVVKDPAFAKERRLIPVSILGVDGITQENDALFKWCVSAYGNREANWEKARKLANKIDQSFVQKLKNRRLWFIQLSDDVSREEAIEIYIRTNQSSSLIKSFDIAVAEYDRQDEDSLRNEIMEWTDRTSAAQCLFNTDPEKSVSEIGELILKIACLQTKRTPTDSNYWAGDVVEHLHGKDGGIRTIEKGLEWAFAMLEEFHIFYKEHLPSVVPLRVVPALYPGFRRIKDPDHQSAARKIISTFLWRSFLGNRYARGANTRLKEDHDGLAEALSHISKHGLEEIRGKILNIPIFFESVEFPKEKELTCFKNPIKPPTTKNALSRSLLVISTLGGAYDFASGEKILKHTIRERERHHIFPKQFLQKNKFEIQVANHALNFALIGNSTNRTLSNKPPLKYLQERYLKNSSLSENDMRKRIDSHLIPYDAIKDVSEENVKATYRHFIQERAKLFEKKVSELIKVPFL